MIRDSVTMLALLWAPVPALASDKPAQLGCVERHFAVAAREVDGGWRLVAPGVDVAWNRPQKRSFAVMLDDPDVADMFALPYRAGPITPVVTVDDDPGRIRVEALFRATYPARGLRRVTFFGHPITVHEKAVPSLARVEARLTPLDPALRPWVDQLGGGYNDRVIAGTQRRSAHAFGLAIDLNPKRAQYWRWEKGGWRNTVPQAIVDAFEAEGFIWGGRWFHFDTMHFEYRPEIYDCQNVSGVRP